MRQIVLLRGINLGARNRVSMPDLRRHLEQARFSDVQTYVQSGNVVLESALSPRELAERVSALIAEAFDLDIAVLARTRDELAQVVTRNPLGEVAENPKRYQVSFLSEELAPDVAERLDRLRQGEERVVVQGREVYAWHPEGVARSKLWNALAGKGLGVDATARNWSTVTTLLSMADGG